MQRGRDGRRLNELPLFRGLTPNEFAQVTAALHPVRFAAGAAVLTAEQPGEVAYVVVQGTLKVALVRADGSEVTLSLLGPGDVVGELSLIDRAVRSADVIALEPVEAVWLDRTAFGRLRVEVPGLIDNLIALLARRLRQANQQILALATLDVQERVARQLLVMADTYGERHPDGTVLIPVRLTQSDLASLCGATRVRVNQVMVAFKQRGWVATDGRHWTTIRDRGALEGLL